MNKVPGSIFRRSLFWAHLCCGVPAGVLILIMSATGVLLAYESQIVAARMQMNRVSLTANAPRMSADQLIEKARAAAPPGMQLNLVFDADPTLPVVASYGRQQLLLHPQTGAVLPDAAAGTRKFFRSVENWHRWLGGNPRSVGGKLMDLANLLFLFMIVSGIYLWLPAVYKWSTVRGLALFRTRYLNSKVRDFSWHHVFSVWMFIPLFLIALSGVVGSYPWANTLLFAAFGEKPAQRQGPGPSGENINLNRAGRARVSGTDIASQRVTAQQLLDVARSRLTNWQRITLPTSQRGGSVILTAELKSDDTRPRLQLLTLSTQDASVIRLSQPSTVTQSPGRRARAWMRFVHTGEQYGVIGQTVAALASLSACFLVYTGLALAWRRLVFPLYRLMPRMRLLARKSDHRASRDWKPVSDLAED